jgi:hypothetical protein
MMALMSIAMVDPDTGSPPPFEVLPSRGTFASDENAFRARGHNVFRDGDDRRLILRFIATGRVLRLVS